MTRLARLIVMLASACSWSLVSGCTFSVPQFESAIALARGLMVSEDATSTDVPATWLASVDGRGAVLSPYKSNHLIVFANGDGDAIAFDGWIIRSVVGFGLKSPLSISGRDGARTFSVAGQKEQTNCDEWNLTGLIWSQACLNGSGEIVLDSDGDIQKITMAIGSRPVIVTLQVAK